MANSKQVGGLVGPTPVAMLLGDMLNKTSRSWRLPRSPCSMCPGDLWAQKKRVARGARLNDVA